MTLTPTPILICRAEQIRCATLLLAGHHEQAGLRLAVSDWVMEELLLGEENART